MWGFTRGSRIYIVAFMPLEHEAHTGCVEMHEDEYDHSEDEAHEEKLQFIGTIHSHPRCDETIFSEGDLRDSLDSQEIVMGICAIDKKGKRRQTLVSYWPCTRPLNVLYDLS